LKKALVVIFLGYVLLLIETAMGFPFQLGQIRLDGLVPLVAWYGLQYSLPGGILAVLGLGILSEQMSAMPVGLYVLAYTGEYLMIRYVLNHIVCAAAWQQIMLVSFLSIEVVAVLLIGSGAAELLWPWGFAQALLNGVLAPFWFFVFNKANSIISSEDMWFGVKEHNEV
jgi:cell shape-determining protein MreD